MLFEWTSDKQKAFEIIKAKLAIVLIIVYFNFDKLFILYINILGESIEAVLH